tara:strand:+ start:103 stop:1254 length:1152 start_codon:yes stop_codon:yes gene_type:complete
MSYDPYKELELSPPCNDEEIRKAYLRLALKYHPDRNPGKDTKVEFQKISKAYTDLSERNKRFEDYKNSYETYSKWQKGDFETVDDYKKLFETLFENHKDWIQNIPTEWVETSNTIFENYINNPKVKLAVNIIKKIPNKDTLLSTFKSFITSSQHSESESESESSVESNKNNNNRSSDINIEETVLKKGENIIQHLNVTLQELYRRDIKKINILRYKYNNKEENLLKEEHTVLVPIENNINFYPEEGDQKNKDEIPGDLFFIINDIPDPLFKRNKDNQFILECKIDISPFELCYGGEKIIVHPSLTKINLTIKEHFYERINSNPTILPSFGLWNSEKNQYEDLYIYFNLLSDEKQTQDFKKIYYQKKPTNILDDINYKIHNMYV